MSIKTDVYTNCVKVHAWGWQWARCIYTCYLFLLPQYTNIHLTAVHKHLVKILNWTENLNWFKEEKTHIHKIKCVNIYLFLIVWEFLLHTAYENSLEMWSFLRISFVSSSKNIFLSIEYLVQFAFRPNNESQWWHKNTHKLKEWSKRDIKLIKMLY